jgi:hypothetical protein
VPAVSVFEKTTKLRQQVHKFIALRRFWGEVCTTTASAALRGKRRRLYCGWLEPPAQVSAPRLGDGASINALRRGWARREQKRPALRLG